MKPTRVLLAEDHVLVRAGIRALLAAMPDVDVVAEASDGREALRLVAEHRPDIVLMDIAMSGLNGLEATAQVTRDFEDTRVIILSMHAGQEYVWQALDAGAAGYLLKDAAAVELELAIRAVARGETYLSPPVSSYLIANHRRRIHDPSATQSDPVAPFTVLTSRQREVLQLIAEGYKTRAIADILHVSVKTVETHRAQLMERLGIYDVAGLVRYAIHFGLTSTHD